MSEDLTSKGKALLANGWCADCGRELMPGPKGGAAQNFYCVNRDDCRQGFNLTFWQGKLAIAQRIGEVSDDAYKMYVK